MLAILEPMTLSGPMASWLGSRYPLTRRGWNVKSVKFAGPVPLGARMAAEDKCLSSLKKSRSTRVREDSQANKAREGFCGSQMHHHV